MPSEAKWAISAAVGIGLILAGWRVYPLLVTTHVLVCFMLVIVVLLQSGKAADLAGAFGGSGSQTAFGPRGAATFLSKATTWCAIMFMVTSMTMVLRQSKQQGSFGSVLERVGTKKSVPVPTPVVPGTQLPVTSSPTTPAPAPKQSVPSQQTPPAQQQSKPPAKP